ncbi:uncharacterized protein LOC120440637 [Oreochromis aureus]|uniref:uncharacterized protein LOC120440637 n=1 Tax=Oreochromis aureus TaxID=47969 RepID=UPI0019545FFF|nr:uncharacterized protein LOC120440637 [Oreochromis aureus]
MNSQIVRKLKRVLTHHSRRIGSPNVRSAPEKSLHGRRKRSQKPWQARKEPLKPAFNSAAKLIRRVLQPFPEEDLHIISDVILELLGRIECRRVHGGWFVLSRPVWQACGDCREDPKGGSSGAVHPYRVSAVLLNTGCPDCLVIYSNMTVGRIEVRALKLLSRRVRVSAAELEEFTKQAECLNLQPPAIMDSEKGLCPDPSLAPETNFTDGTTNRLNSEELSLLEELLSSESGVKTLLDMIQRSMASSKQD